MEEISKITDESIAINISTGKKYLTQRDNKIKPFGTCNTTSMCMALTYSGKVMPGKKDEEQYEDLLTSFLLTDPRVLAYYERIDPVNYAAWKANPSSPKVIPPNEYHAVLAYGTNLWMNAKVVSFTTTSNLAAILYSLIQNRAVVLSGLWSGLRHIVCAVGFVTTQQNILSASSPADIDLNKVTSIIVDDPFGNYKTKYQDVNGNDISVTLVDFKVICREFNSDIKWAHMILPT